MLFLGACTLVFWLRMLFTCWLVGASKQGNKLSSEYDTQSSFDFPRGKEEL